MNLNIIVYNDFTKIDLLQPLYSKVEVKAFKLKILDLLSQGHNNLFINMNNIKNISANFIKAMKIIYLYSLSNNVRFAFYNLDKEVEILLCLNGLISCISFYTDDDVIQKSKTLLYKKKIA